MNNSTTTYKRLGDYIREVDVRNSAMEVNLSQGICNMKYFQNPRQVSSTPHLDKIVRTGQFAYNRATTRNGNKISIAYREGPDCTVSSAYCVFYITDEEVLNPYYLWLWFKRPDFDRYAIFKSHGSAHEFFEFETLCNTYVPIPSIEVQRQIVSNYLAIQHRIETNKQTIAKLEEAAQALYRKMFVDNIDPNNLPEGWRWGTISDLGDVVGGATPSTENKSYWVDEGISWLSPADMPRNVMFVDRTAKHITKEAYDSASTKLLPIGTILFSSRAPIGLTAIADIELCTNQGYKSIVPFNEYGSFFIYYTMLKEKDKIAGQQEGSTFAEISGKELAAYPVVIPMKQTVQTFNNIIKPSAQYRKCLEKENVKLEELTILLQNNFSK